MNQKPKIHTSQIVYRGFFDIRQDLFERESGEELLSYTSLLLPFDAAVVLAQDRHGHWILNREYRHPTGEFILGCPGGRLEPGEDPLEGGRRELFEETGYWSDEIQLLGTCYAVPSLTNQKISFLSAKNAFKKGAKRLDPLERIETELKTTQELKEEIQKGCCIDAVLGAALWYWTLNLSQ